MPSTGRSSNSKSGMCQGIRVIRLEGKHRIVIVSDDENVTFAAKSGSYPHPAIARNARRETMAAKKTTADPEAAAPKAAAAAKTAAPKKPASSDAGGPGTRDNPW